MPSSAVPVYDLLLNKFSNVARSFSLVLSEPGEDRIPPRGYVISHMAEFDLIFSNQNL